ncbi:DUF5691 domain-containing protein [Streptomyces sp. TR02-1]|uniref:DUF5691 domain-containing protein n=1 Tax=Streptomyces sp. TR02-1 TaxID=3385977 RepID=UPI0039A2F090
MHDDRTPWSELVTAAMLGTEWRRPPGGDARALLGAAAAETLRRRAGARPAAAAPVPGTAPEDPRPPLPAPAAARLALLLAHRSGGGAGHRRSTEPDPGELLPQWLAAARDHGYRPPYEELPALLNAARARTDLRAAVLSFGGPRARWLAGLNPEWRFALRGAGHAPPGPVDPAAEQRLWAEGLFVERLAVLGGLRRRDPAAGLALLEHGWSGERAEDRLVFLETLRETLRPEDEAFLSRALTDRSRIVRATAAELLSALPESALATRMAERALACVGPDSAGGGILVEPPEACDAGMRRDGVAPRPPSGRGERSWWLGQLVGAAPLSAWHARFGGRSAAGIVALPVAGGWGADLHAGWCRAAVRQRNPVWARALAGPASAPPARGPGDPAKLLAVLPAPERSAWAADFVAAHGLSDAFRILGVCATPWAAPLGRAVLDALEIARDAGSYPWSFSGVMGLAERCLDPGEAERLAPLTAVAEEPADGSPGAGAYWAEAFQRLVATLRLRTAMLSELRGEPAAAADGPAS